MSMIIVVMMRVIYSGYFSRVWMMVLSRYRLILVIRSWVSVKEIVLMRCVVGLNCLSMNFGMECILEL